MGYIVLQGGSEFEGLMNASDLRALQLAGGKDTRVSIIPAAAAPDANDQRAGKNGCQWFRSLGACNVAALPVVDRSSANNPNTAALLRRSGLIYLLGGFPGYLAQTLADTLAWQSIKTAMEQGAVVAGSSAGAMVMCSHLFDPDTKAVINGLGMIPDACILPHHNTFGKTWAAPLRKELPEATLIGIDEQTGTINDGVDGCWTVHGRGAVTLYRDNRTEHYAAGTEFQLLLTMKG